ncbi:MAG: tRNA threonylcarbamoyladenosine biosynthesis protein TsaB [Planctomycetota bacterium]|jgi:tRNA threonylcarbamoyladenosine biosynthesis protein TsaB
MNRTILAIDCSQRRSVLAVARGPVVHARWVEPLAEGTRAGGREVFWDELRALMSEAAVEPWEFEGVAVATGPGGFTGLRVAIAFAKAFALAREVPVVGIGSAMVFAASDAARGGKGPWLVALASKGATAWCARVRRDVEAPFSEDAGEVLDASAFLPRASAIAAAGGAVLSDEHLAPELAKVAGSVGAHVRPILADPCALAMLAQLAFSAGRTVDPLALTPIYPREPEAVTKWRERHGG